MKKTKTKLNYKNIFRLIILTGCLYLIVHDLYMLLIYPIITGKLTALTMYGLVILISAVAISSNILEQLKKCATR